MEKPQFLIANFLLYQYSLISNALLCLGKEVPRNPPALHAGPPRFFARTKKLSKKCFAISSLRGVSTTFACYRTTQSKLSNWQISKRTLRFLANEWLEQWTQGFENLYCSARQIVPRRVLIVPHEIRVKKSQ